MRGRIELTGFPQSSLSFNGRQDPGLLAKPLSFLSKTFFKANPVWLHSLHAAAPFRERKAGAQPAFSSPINTQNRSVTSDNGSAPSWVP
jgi:hypothetical protein